MDIIKEIEALKREYMSDYAQKNPAMANVTLRLLGHVLGEYDYDGWKKVDQYPTLVNAHLLRILLGMQIKLEDRWNYATAKPGGNLFHVFERLLEQFKGYDDESSTSGWADDYWDDCYILLALIEARRDPGAAPLLRECNRIVNEGLGWMADRAMKGFPNVQNHQWTGPGFHAAALQLFLVAARDNLYGAAVGVIDAVAKDLENKLQKGPGTDPWDNLFPWHIGQVVTAWSRVAAGYPSVKNLDPLVRKYYDELISPTRRTPGAGFDNGGRQKFPEYVIFSTARGLTAAYCMDSQDVIDDAHAFIAAEMDAGNSMLRGFKACVNMLESLQMKMQCRMPNPELHLVLEIGARLVLTDLYEPLLGTFSASDVKKTIRKVREATRDTLERQGKPALQPLGVNAELMKFARNTPELLAEFDGNEKENLEALEAFLSATMTELRAKAARKLLKRLWTHKGFLDYVGFFERLAELEHEQSFFANDRAHYRDHLNHQIHVFLLGTYVFQNDSALKQSLLEEINRIYDEHDINRKADDHELIFRWKMASTFHDVGYLFEVSPTDGDPATAKKLIDASVSFVADWIDRFLIDYLKGHGNSAADAQSVAAAIKPKIPAYKSAVAGIDDIFELDHMVPPGDAFAAMSLLLPPRLGANLLRNYYDMCRTVSVKPRKEFYDHGIMSAAVLLKTADVQRHYLTALRELANKKLLAGQPALKQVLKDPDTEEHLKGEQFWLRFAHVAGAIALHNVYPTLHDEATCRAHGLVGIFHDPAHADQFRIDSKENPMAYLLAFTDGLQDWDRHSFRPPSVADRSEKMPLSGHEILLAYRQQKLHAVGLNNAARARYKDRIREMKITLADLDAHITQSHMLR